MLTSEASRRGAAPWKWRPCWRCAGPCVTAPCGSTTAWRFAAANGCLSPQKDGKRGAIPTIGACHCRSGREVYLEPLIERAQAGVAAVAKAVEAGDLKVDDELHLTPLAAEEEEPELVKLRAALDHRIGEAQLPELLLQVDAKVRFSWIMLGREPRSDKELLMVYDSPSDALGRR